jgi:hypothetical protein
MVIGRRLTGPNRCSTVASMIAGVVTTDAAHRGQQAHGFTIAAVEGEGHPHLLAVVAADLEAVRASGSVRLVHGNTAVMPLLGAADMPIKQQAMSLDNSVDPLVVGRLAALGHRPTV